MPYDIVLAHKKVRGCTQTTAGQSYMRWCDGVFQEIHTESCRTMDGRYCLDWVNRKAWKTRHVGGAFGDR